MKDNIELEPNDSAFVLRDGKIVEFIIPQMKDDENVSHDIIVITTIAILLKQKDLDFLNLITEKWNKYTEISKEDLEE